MKSLINRRAAKAADSMWRRKGMFSTGTACPEAQQQIKRPIQTESKDSGDCPNFIPEKDNCYPLCDNPTCARKYECCKSAHMIERSHDGCMKNSREA